MAMTFFLTVLFVFLIVLSCFCLEIHDAPAWARTCPLLFVSHSKTRRSAFCQMDAPQILMKRLMKGKDILRIFGFYSTPRCGYGIRANEGRKRTRIRGHF